MPSGHNRDNARRVVRAGSGGLTQASLAEETAGFGRRSRRGWALRSRQQFVHGPFDSSDRMRRVAVSAHLDLRGRGRTGLAHRVGAMHLGDCEGAAACSVENWRG